MGLINKLREMQGGGKVDVANAETINLPGGRQTGYFVELGIAADEEQQSVHIVFDKPRDWLALSKDQAIAIANGILQAAERLETVQ